MINIRACCLCECAVMFSECVTQQCTCTGECMCRLSVCVCWHGDSRMRLEFTGIRKSEALPWQQRDAIEPALITAANRTNIWLIPLSSSGHHHPPPDLLSPRTARLEQILRQKQDFRTKATELTDTNSARCQEKTLCYAVNISLETPTED